MGQLLEQRFANDKNISGLVQPYLDQVKANGNLMTYAFFTFPVSKPSVYDAGKLVTFLKNLNVDRLTKQMKDSRQNKSLTIERLWDFVLEWTTLMTIADARDQHKEFGLSSREQMRLLEFLSGEKDVLVQLFPIVMPAFTRLPLSVESILGMMGRPIGPIGVMTGYKDSDYGSPLEELLHDLYHLRDRLGVDYGFLFEGTPDKFFPDTHDLMKVEKAYAPTPRQISVGRTEIQKENAFHKYIFESIKQYPKNIQIAAQLIWFDTFFRVDNSQHSKVTGISPDALVAKVDQAWGMIKLGVLYHAPQGEYGTQFTHLELDDVEKAREALTTLAQKYKQGP